MFFAKVAVYVFSGYIRKVIFLVFLFNSPVESSAAHATKLSEQHLQINKVKIRIFTETAIVTASFREPTPAQHLSGFFLTKEIKRPLE
jgi:hypothetical protein